jgi:hypothetical protein
MSIIDRVRSRVIGRVGRAAGPRQLAGAAGVAAIVLVVSVALAAILRAPVAPATVELTPPPTTVAGVAGSAEPSSTDSASAVPSAVASDRVSPSESTEQSPLPGPAQPTPTPETSTPGSGHPHTYRFQEGDDPDADYSEMVEVVDESGTVKSARHAQPEGPEADFQVRIPDGPVQMGFLRLPTEPNSLVVGWRADPCNTRDRLTISDDASTIGLASSPTIGCPNPHTPGHRIVLAFDRSVDITKIRATRGQTFIGPDDIRPNTISLSTGSDVWIGGWTQLGESFLLHSTNAGDNWKLDGLGWGHVLDVAPLGGATALAAAGCSGIRWRCDQGLFGSGDLAMRIGWDPVLRLSMRSESDGISILGPYPGGGDCCYWLRPTTTAGLGIAEVLNPCEAGDRPADVVKLDDSAIETLCVSEGSNQDKTLISSLDSGRTWVTIASSDTGNLPKSGAVKGFDMSAGGFGLVWGAGARSSVTRDGGKTWQPSSVADGEVRVARGGDVLSDTTGALLVWDGRRSRTVVLITRDAGASWSEMTSLAGG